jgi:hypothetical protein
MGEEAMVSEVVLPNVEPEWGRLPTGEQDSSLVTQLGIIEGEVLTCLERHGRTTLRQIIRDLEWPAPIVTMAVGAAIRQGLVRAVRRDLEVVLEPERGWRAPMRLPREPEVWGG